MTDHTTYRLTQEPRVGVLWVYAQSQPDGSFVNVGGGTHDAAANTYGQGALTPTTSPGQLSCTCGSGAPQATCTRKRMRTSNFAD